jgi:hypothetical protein
MFLTVLYFRSNYCVQLSNIQIGYMAVAFITYMFHMLMYIYVSYALL